MKVSYEEILKKAEYIIRRKQKKIIEQVQKLQPKN